MPDRSRAIRAPAAAASLLLAVLAGSLPAPAPAQQARDGSFCGFLTRPSIRPDGGGTNFHAGGQFLCHDGRARRCENYRWVDKGPCSAHGALPEAYEIEGGSPQEEKPAEGDAASGAGGGGDPGVGGGGGIAAGTTLLGDSPEAERLEREQEELERERRRFEEAKRRQEGSGAAARGSAGHGGATGGERGGVSDAARCAELSRALAQIDANLRAIANYANAFTNDGSTHGDMRRAKVELEGARAATQSEKARIGCP